MQFKTTLAGETLAADSLRELSLQWRERVRTLPNRTASVQRGDGVVMLHKSHVAVISPCGSVWDRDDKRLLMDDEL